MAGRSRNDWAAFCVLAGSVSGLIAPGAQAKALETKADVSIPAGTLANALVSLAEQTGLSIAASDPALAKLRTGGLHGRYTPRNALDRLLKGSGYSARFIDARTVQLIRMRRAAPVAPEAPRTPATPIPITIAPDILVTATKQNLGLDEYPASVAVIETDRSDLARGGGRGTGFILGHLPQLTATNLGPGRNKIFIRGIADSSFNGASQSTIGQYLGDFRTIYSAPDPDLPLYDISRVEVLEGPQGTLYGAGTLGGIIRIEPVAPDLEHREVDASAGATFTRSGSPGTDGALVVNAPIVRGSLALRALAYGSIEGGYIDDLERDLKNINRNTRAGARVQLRWQPRSDWTVDLSLVGQNIHSRDGQYTLKDEADLTRRSAIAQPFDNDYRLIGLTLTHQWGDVKLVSATGYSGQHIDSVYDATADEDALADGAALEVFRENQTVHLFSHETRASGSLGSQGSWLLGIGVVDSSDHVVRRLGPLDDPPVITDVLNTTLDSAVFGEAGVPVLRHVILTLGSRLSYVRQTSAYAAIRSERRGGPERQQVRLLPTAALSWTPQEGLLFYGRFQDGYRPGGLEVTGSGLDGDTAMQTAQRFASDRLHSFELGMRFGMTPGARLSGSLAASATRWRDIQADLIDTDGLPYVANIGAGRVLNLAATLRWQPTRALSLEAAGYLNSSDLTDPAPGFGALSDRDLPNIADEGWRLAGKWKTTLRGAPLTLDGTVRHVGRSKLAVSEPFALEQGDYFDVSAGARIGLGRWGLSLDVMNLLDSRGNTFAYGNPFSAAEGEQETPIRPRSIRIGVDAAF
ncbi:TonB-dependent receptor domain-containing protein [Novosphingobium sp. 9]|uniref:TonB-dependent receptor domain-containing protein n=1 Tax=Novosphingobium sp. 9 TaxID=2025349 RepID=UPI0021B5D018|nr:TonB-dependent receptor [Novosphingobium sp. 9]